jgi:hypothetical protein
MNPLRFRRGHFASALALGLALLAAACGPGVGGTGVGPSTSALPAFSAAPAALCASDLAAQLACSTAAASPAGTGAVDFADASAPHRVSLRFEGNRVELQAPCAALQFSGEWGRAAGQTARFYGHVGAELATLVALPAGNGLSVEVFDNQGRTIFGPQLVERQAAAVAPDCR